MAVQEEISNAKSRVLLISFGVQEGAQKWLEEMNCSYDMLLDKDRKVYQAFGLKRSVFKVWSISSMTYYAQQMAEGRDLPKPYENIHDDPIQMGGDFVMDKEGKMKLIYCSATPRDRPSATMLLDIIKK
ncbi:hypothetical protein SNE40_008768 [Patella caerulea]|uniref:Alkyl hydroperoxide reductase subunit C/ Thiol specific antioxidant domain-containing protein n=1 Tax=Patella caerulea TaxID=87958 RepID=A0AAN8PP25_PATCE